MDELPDEILLMIFSYVTPHRLDISASKVCQRWERLISQRVLRLQRPGDEKKLQKNLQALLVTSYVPIWSESSAIISHIIHITSHLRHLTLYIDYGLKDTDFKTLETMKSLQHLDIFSNKKILDEDTPISSKITSFVANDVIAPGFLKRLQNQNTMTAFHMYGRSIFYPPKELTAFLRQNSISLRELTLRCSNLAEFRYWAIGMCQGLTSLQLYTCSQLSFRGISNITRLENLRRLHLTGMRMIRVEALHQLISNLPKRIEELNLSCSWFGEEHCTALVTRLPDLRYLELWRCRILAHTLINLATSLTSLEKLDTDVLLDRDSVRALETNPSLMSVRCRWNGDITTRLNMTSALERIPYQLLRADEEGPQSSLFYYWTQGVLSSTLSVTNPFMPTSRSMFETKSSSIDLIDCF